MSDSEYWLPVPGFPTYEVSDLGGVRRLSGRGALKATVDTNGYCVINLRRDGVAKRKYVHRLVCEAFNGPAPTKGHHAAHINGNRADPRLANVRWATAKENSADRVRHGTYSRLLTLEQVREIRSKPGPVAHIAAEYGISRAYVSAIRHRVNWADVP